MKKIITIGLLFVSLVVMAQFPHEQPAQGVSMPSVSFRSTGSDLMSTGSAYSATPVLNADGIASINGSSYAPAQRIGGGPRKADAFDDNSEDMPLGSPVLPLLLFVAAYVLFKTIRRKNEA